MNVVTAHFGQGTAICGAEAGLRVRRPVSRERQPRPVHPAQR